MTAEYPPTALGFICHDPDSNLGRLDNPDNVIYFGQQPIWPFGSGVTLISVVTSEDERGKYNFARQDWEDGASWAIDDRPKGDAGLQYYQAKAGNILNKETLSPQDAMALRDIPYGLLWRSNMSAEEREAAKTARSLYKLGPRQEQLLDHLDKIVVAHATGVYAAEHGVPVSPSERFALLLKGGFLDLSPSSQHGKEGKDRDAMRTALADLSRPELSELAKIAQNVMDKNPDHSVGFSQARNLRLMLDSRDWEMVHTPDKTWGVNRVQDDQVLPRNLLTNWQFTTNNGLTSLVHAAAGHGVPTVSSPIVNGQKGLRNWLEQKRQAPSNTLEQNQGWRTEQTQPPQSARPRGPGL